ncbi:MAG TPA: PBP1A family penicillin-binding protein [Alphaproteobacteria bacterium]|nr:PBP1A family penicillin-binding protein [Alphaproteobacteria bacterium]
MILSIWGLSFAGLAILWFSYDLPDVKQLQSTTRKPSVVMQTQDGQVVGTYGDLYEDMVSVKELPPYVPQALMAVEDRRFYHHFGVDIIGIARAFYTNYKADRIVQGASTLTQQLSKNFLQSQGLYDINDRSIRRKMQEVLLSFWLEWNFTKDQIITMYLNRVYFGAGTYGVDAAALKYFQKSAKELTVYEAAIIAGLLKAPSKYSPAHNPKKAHQRALVVLKLMQEAGFIKEVEPYLNQSLENKDTSDQCMKFFTDWVYDSLNDYVDFSDKDLIVVVTVDPAFQRQAQEGVKTMIKDMGRDLHVGEMAFVAMTPDGAVKAMIGGQDYSKSQFNRAYQAQRQAGSAFKLFVYLSALEAGYDTQSMVEDTPIQVGTWKPSLYMWIPQGEISLETAFKKSVNPVTVRLALSVGAPKIAAIAHRMGISSKLGTDLSMALGSKEVSLLELTSAFAVLSNQGNRCIPYGILEIRNKATGEILYTQKTQTQKVLSTTVTEKMRHMLFEVVNAGTGRGAKIDRPVYGKTGSNGDSDAWFVGFTSDMVAGVWAGNDSRRTDMKKISTGGRLPARTWAHIMKGYYSGTTSTGEVFLSPSKDLEKVLSSPSQSDLVAVEEDEGLYIDPGLESLINQAGFGQ